MSGRQDIGVLTTVAIGALGGLIGSAVASQFGYHNANGGVAWIPFFIGVGAAIVLIAIYESVVARRTRSGLRARIIDPIIAAPVQRRPEWTPSRTTGLPEPAGL